MKKRQKDNERELDFIRRKSLFILSYLENLETSYGHLIKKFKDILDVPSETYSLTSMKMLVRDIEAFSKSFQGQPGFDKKELKNLLDKHFSKELYPSTINLIRAILEKKFIDNQDDAEIANQFIGDTMEGDEYFDEIPKLQHMLYIYGRQNGSKNNEE